MIVSSQRDLPESVLIRVYVQPRASANRICGIHAGALKIRITAPPVDGKANQMVVVFFAKLLKIPKSAVQVVSGKSSRSKTLKISGLNLKDVSSVIESKIGPLAELDIK